MKTGEKLFRAIMKLVMNGEFVYVMTQNFGSLSNKRTRMFVSALIEKRQQNKYVCVVMRNNLPFRFNILNYKVARTLIENNINVYVNPKIHSKLVITDYGVYVGSANISGRMNSMYEIGTIITDAHEVSSYYAYFNRIIADPKTKKVTQTNINELFKLHTDKKSEIDFAWDERIYVIF